MLALSSSIAVEWRSVTGSYRVDSHMLALSSSIAVEWRSVTGSYRVEQPTKGTD